MIQPNLGNVRRARLRSDTCVAETPMAKPFEILANCGSATLYVLMEVARSVGTALRAAIATTIVVDHGSDCDAGGIRWNECKTLLRLNGMTCFVASKTATACC